MPPRPRVRIDRAAVADLLLSEPFRNITNEAARDVGEKAGGRRKGVIVDEYTTDRTAAAVKVPAARQARGGALTRAAAAAGLEVRVRA